jgi:hypothetical protein
MTRLRLAAALAVLAFVAVGTVGAAGTQLNGSVGPGFAISLKDGSGATVTRLDAGAFTLTVDDKSEEHNFHLRGPGVDVSTDIETTGTNTFPLDLVDGKYTFVCDPHAGQMRGSFIVGEVTTTPPPATKPAVRLSLTVTSKAVTLTTPTGKPVTALSVGQTVITVRDRSAARGVRLTGAGVNRSTTAKFVGTVTWTVKLSAGSLAYGSDARKPVLKGGRVPVS